MVRKDAQAELEGVIPRWPFSSTYSDLKLSILHLTPNSRAVRDIFQEVSVLEDTTYILRVSFVELYNEQLFDLLSSKPRREDTMVDIREDGKGIKIPGLTEVEVGSD